MKEKIRTSNLYKIAGQALILIGQPLFKALLLSFYALLLSITLFLRSSIYLIKSWVDIADSFIEIFSNFSEKLSKSINNISSSIKSLIIYLSPDRIKKTALRKALLYTLLPLLIVLIISFSIYQIAKDLPNPDKLKNRNQIVSTKIYDRNRNLLYKIYKNENRTIVELEDIPPHLIQATISIEDKDFYRHSGYSYSGIIRALRHTLFEGKIEGGSTITQQLVKNALLSKEQTLKRKLKEIILSILTESKFSKDEILSMYFNEVGYGGAAYGAEEASQLYFAKPVKQLNLAEAALLAGLPVAPTKYSPFGANPELAKFRQHQVLRRMTEEGYISAEEAEQAKSQNLKFAPHTTDIQAPHFVMYIKNLLVEKYGEQMVEQGGLEVITSLDLKVQKLAQEVVAREVSRLENLNITNGAGLVTNPQTGEVLAMVGSVDFFDIKRDGQVNVTLRPRQPGSAIKPVNYAVALENGMTAATLISDTPITYQIPGQPPYSPKNYDGKFHGTVSLRQALASSYNVPAVKTLSVFGVDKMINKGQSMGVSTWKDESRFGLSLTLGGGEVKMTDLAVVYGSLASQGNRLDLQPILQTSDYRGNLLYRYSCRQEQTSFFNQKAAVEETCNPKEVIKPEVAFILNNILSDNQARAPAFGSYSLLRIPNQQVAVKTGTTQNLRDNWTIGYTSDLLVATWVGNNDNSPMSYVASGLTGASPIWNQIITSLLADDVKHTFPMPNNIKKVAICPSTGTLPCETCPGRPEYFLEGTEPTLACVPKIATQEQDEEEKPEISLESMRSGAQQNLDNKSFRKLLKKVKVRN